jgi:hypothetical protein
MYKSDRLWLLFLMSGMLVVLTRYCCVCGSSGDIYWNQMTKYMMVVVL